MLITSIRFLGATHHASSVRLEGGLGGEGGGGGLRASAVQWEDPQCGQTKSDL